MECSGITRVAHRAQAEMRAMTVMSFQKCGQSFDLDDCQPQSDRLPVAVQLVAQSHTWRALVPPVQLRR